MKNNITCPDCDKKFINDMKSTDATVCTCHVTTKAFKELEKSMQVPRERMTEVMGPIDDDITVPLIPKKSFKIKVGGLTAIQKLMIELAETEIELYKLIKSGQDTQGLEFKSLELIAKIIKEQET